MIAIIVMMFVIVLLVVLGIVFINGRGSSLIAGYNTMSLEEKNIIQLLSATALLLIACSENNNQNGNSDKTDSAENACFCFSI